MINEVLLVEDDASLRRALAQTLELAGIEVTQADGFAQASKTLQPGFRGVVLSDIRMPDSDGFDVLKCAQTQDPDIPVVLLTGEGDVPTAVRAMNEGAWDFLEKPCAPDHLVKVLRRAFDHRHLLDKNRQMERRLRHSDPAATNFPGQSHVAQDLRQALRKASELPVHLHLVGPNGSGKRLAAHTVHSLSTERDGFLSVSLLSERSKIVDGTNPIPAHTDLSIKYLDAATPAQQDWLLEQIETIQGLRVMTSSHLSLDELRKAGLSEDLYFALSLMEIPLPTLAERKQDLPVLFETLLRQTVRSLNLDMPLIPASLTAEVMARSWPDNLPELRNFARSFALGLTPQSKEVAEIGLAEQIEVFEKMVLSETLERKQGKAVDAADALGLPRKTLYDKLAKYGLKPRDFRG